MSLRQSLTVHLLLAMLSTAVLIQSSQADQIRWRHNVDAAKLEAQQTGKLVMLHFYTESCGPCKKLDREVYSQPQIATTMEQNFVPVKLNADESPAYASQFQITRVPTEVVLDPRGNVLQKLSCPLTPEAYGSQLVNVAQHYRGRPAHNATRPQGTANPAYAGLQINQSHQSQTPQGASPASGAPMASQNPYANAGYQTSRQVTPARPAPAQAAAPTPQPQTIANHYGPRYSTAAPRVAEQTRPVVSTPAKPATATPTQPAAPAARRPAVSVPAETSNRTVGQVMAPTVNARPASAEQQVVMASSVVENVWPPKLPVGSPPLAFEGYCPVSLQKERKWVRGDKTFGAIHRGRTYLLTSEESRQHFLASPDAYSPVFSGSDPVLVLDENREVAGNRRFGFEYRGAFYLFSSQETMDLFASRPDHYSMGVRQAMNQMDRGTGTIRR